MVNKKIIVAIAIIFVLILIVYQVFFSKKEPAFELFLASRGTVSQEISETGQVEKGEEVTLGFQSAGKIEKIYVQVGQNVKSGEKLAKIDTTNLLIQLREAEANFDAQKARLTELQKGTRAEEIQISQTLLNQANTELDSLYKDTAAVLNQSYNLADNTIRQEIAALFLYRVGAAIPYYDLTYKYCDNQSGVDATAQRKISENELNIWRTELQNLKEVPQILNEALLKAESRLTLLRDFLNRLNDTLTTDCKLTWDEINKINTYKLVVNSALTNINTALISVYSQRKAIEAQKLIVQSYQEQLNLKLAGSTPEQIAYQEAQLNQAKARVALLEHSLREATLVSPVEGQITKINKEIGEQVQPMLQDVVIIILPISPFEIEANIYEEDVVKIEIGNPVDISLVAFPKRIFKGKIVVIHPSQKIIEGVVYYEIIVGPTSDLETWIPDTVKPGMTADLTIQTALKENVLIVPEKAIQEKNGKALIQIFQAGKIQDRAIETGLWGTNDLVEVFSGLEEGEQVVIMP